MQRLVSLDYLRGFSALAVASAHFIMIAQGSYLSELVAAIAVEIFFPLSGFVLAPQIIKVWQQNYHIKVFLIRRWLRTVPPYILAVISMTIVLDQFSSEEFLKYLFFLNYLSLSDLDSLNDFYPVAWSLAVEEWFYIIFPLLVVVASRLTKSTVGLAFCGVMLVVLGIISRWVTSVDVDPDHIRISTLLRLDAIAVGFIFFLLFSRIRSLSSLPLIILGSVIGIVILLLTHQSNLAPREFGNLLLAFAPMIFGAVIFLLAIGEQTVALRTNNTCQLVGQWLGRISYSVYLFHLLVIMLVFPNSSAVVLPAYLVFLIVLCVGFYVLFERPILATRPGYRDKNNKTRSGQ